MRIALATLLIGLLAAGCKKKETQADPGLAEAVLRSKVLERLGPAVRALEPRVRELDRMSSELDDFGPYATVPVLDPAARLIELHPGDAFGNTEVLMATEVTSLSRGIIRGCLDQLRRGGDGLAAAQLERQLAECVRIRYIVIVRTYRHDRPEVGATSKTFTGGSFDGDAVLFELPADATGGIKVRGGTQISAAIDRNDEADGGQVDGGSDAAAGAEQQELDAALRLAILQSVERQLTRTPRPTPAPTPTPTPTPKPTKKPKG